MITFERVDIKNFNSIGVIENFIFTDGIHAVKGLNLDEEKSKSNGSGKSSFFDAITWCLYGKTPNGKTADAVVNRVVNKNCYGKLYFSINDIQYRIERYRKHDDEGDGIKVYINEQDKTIHPPSKNQATIDDIIQVPFDLFTSSFIIAQGLNSRFTALTDFQRKETIEDIRNNKVWDKSRELNKIKLKEIKEQISECKLQVAKKGEVAESYQEQLRDLKDELRELMEQKSTTEESSDTVELKKEVESLAEQVDALESEIADLSDERNEADESLSSTNKELLSIPQQIETKRNEIDKYQDVLKLDEVKAEQEKLEGDLKDLKAELGIADDKEAVQESEEKVAELKGGLESVAKKGKYLNDTLNNLENKISQVNNQRDSSKEKIEFYEHYFEEDHDVEECPTCGHIPEEKSEEKMREKYDQQVKLQKELEDALEELKEKREDISSQMSETLEKSEGIKDQIEKVNETINELKKDISQKERETNQFEGQIKSTKDKADQIKQEIIELGIDEDELSQVRGLIEEKKGEIEHLREQNKELSSKAEEFKKEKDRLASLKKSKEEERVAVLDKYKKKREELEKHKELLSSLTTKIDVKKKDVTNIAGNRKDVIEEKEQAIEDKKDLEEKLPVYENLDKIFSPKGIRAHIISKDIGYINQRLDFYSKHFFSDMYVQLDPGIDEEGNVSKIDIPVSTTMNFEKTYEDCSGGEKRRIDICIQLAIFDLILSISSVTTNLLVLDEVFEGLDSEGVKAVMDVIHTKSEEGTCIYVISHLPNLGEHVEDEVVFVKKDGTTEIGESIGNI